MNSARAKGASSAAGSTTPPAGKKMLEVEAPQFNATTRMMMLEHSIRSITDASAAGISPMRALAMEAGRLGPAFGIGLGGTLAIAGISTVVTEFSRAREEAKALKAEVHEALHFENPDFHTQDELQAKLGMTKKAYDDLVKSSQTSTLGDTARMPVAGAQSLATKLWVAFSPDTYMGHADRSKKMAGEFLGEGWEAAGKRTTQGITDLKAQRITEEAGATKKATETVGVTALKQDQGEYGAAATAAYQKWKSQKGSAEGMLNKEAQKEALAANDEEYRVTMAGLDATLFKKQEEIRLTKELAKIKAGGLGDMALAESRAKLESERRLMAVAKLEEKGAAEEKVAAAEADVKALERAAELRRKGAEHEARAAAAKVALVGTTYAQLEAEQKILALTRQGFTKGEAADLVQRQMSPQAQLTEHETRLQMQINRARAKGTQAGDKEGEFLSYQQQYEEELRKMRAVIPDEGMAHDLARGLMASRIDEQNTEKQGHFGSTFFSDSDRAGGSMGYSLLGAQLAGAQRRDTGAETVDKLDAILGAIGTATSQLSTRDTSPRFPR